MVTRAAEKLLTVEEFSALPEPVEGGKLELVGGKVVRMAPVSGEHGLLQVALASYLNTFVRAHRLGIVLVETSFTLSIRPAVVRAPDVAFVRQGRAGRSELRQATLRFAPDLAVEVVSPGDRDAELQQKVEEYLRAGVTRVWVVRPTQESITVHVPGGDAHTYHRGAVVSSADAGFQAEGFALEVSELFNSLNE